MRFGGGALFQTRVARRVMGLFLLCALVPITALGVTSYLHVTGQLRTQAIDRLQSESKSAGMSMLERLKLAESNLRVLHPALATTDGVPRTDMPPGFEPPPSILGLALGRTDGNPTPLFGEGIPAEQLSRQQRDHLSQGSSVIIVASGREPGILLVQAVRPDRLDAGVIWAKLNPPFLWSTEAGNSRLPAGINMCVFASEDMALTCPYHEGMAEAMQRQLGVADHDEFGWTLDGKEYMAARWTLFLEFEFAAPNWQIVLGEPSAQIFAPLADFRRSFPIVLVLALMVVIWVSHRQVRSSMEPLKALTDGTELIARQQFDTAVTVTSGDEFEDLAGSFNAMAHRLGKQFNTLRAMSDIDRAVLSRLDREHIIKTVLRRTGDALSCHSVAVALESNPSDRDAPWRVAVADGGNRHDYEIRIPATELNELESQSGSLVVNRTGETRSYLRDWTSGNGDPVVVFPLHRKSNIAGLIAMEYRTEEHLDAEIREARQLAYQVSVAVSNAYLVEELDSLNAGALTALARTIEANSHWTAGHSERVTKVARAIGSKMRLPQEELDTLYRGGLLHDIGKIGVPPAILNKPGKLTDEEFASVKQHPEIGARILSPIKAYANTIPIVLHHHERFDGQGYPHGLAGEGIPLLARILCVADVYDALTSARPYRQAWSVSKVKRYILEDTGAHFDPAIAAAFGRVLEDGAVEDIYHLRSDETPTDSGNWDSAGDSYGIVLTTGKTVGDHPDQGGHVGPGD